MTAFCAFFGHIKNKSFHFRVFRYIFRSFMVDVSDQWSQRGHDDSKALVICIHRKLLCTGFFEGVIAKNL